MLGSVALAVGTLLPAGCARIDFKVLDRLAYALFPHPPVAKEVYAGLAAGFVDASRESAERLAGSLPSQDELADWIGAHLGNPDLLGFRFAIMSGLYNDLSVTSQFGYQGPSLEQGGYLQRGFDDLDWLPEPAR